jgi:hypothetical protein
VNSPWWQVDSSIRGCLPNVCSSGAQNDQRKTGAKDGMAWLAGKKDEKTKTAVDGWGTPNSNGLFHSFPFGVAFF